MTRDAIEKARIQFENETTEHRMTVLHDDGVYRHLRFAKPSTGMWSWSIVTWPGHLAIAGDIGDGWSFSREHDMVNFFARGLGHGIDFRYWWEKMPGQLRDAGRKFSPNVLKQSALDTIREWELGTEHEARAIAQFEDEWSGVLYESYEQFHGVLDSFEYVVDKGARETDRYEFYDTWEWDSTDFDHHFLLACHAIAFSVRKYREYEAAIEVARLPVAA